MPRIFLACRQVGATLRNYAAATLLNLALVSTVLTPPARPPAAHTRVVRDSRRFRDTELVPLGAGDVGILSLPYAMRCEGVTGGVAIGAN